VSDEIKHDENDVEAHRHHHGHAANQEPTAVADDDDAVEAHMRHHGHI